VSETKEPKIARNGVLIALGIICIVLVACLGGVVASYTLMINDKSNAISSLDYQISQLNSSVANLQNQVASDNSTISSLASEVANLQKQLYPNATYTVVGTLGYANVSAVIVGIIVANISPSFYPNLAGSFMYLTFNGQLTSTLPINAWTFGSMVAINGTISFDEHSQTYVLNWINGSLYSDTVEGVNEQLGLKLTMALQKTNYSLGESISITLTITNVSNQTRNFGLGPDVNDFDFHVYNDTNSNIYWYSSRWVGSAIPLYIVFETLNAGESLNCALVWQQTVSPGTYYIVGRVGPPFFYGENSTMETTPVQITIG
jgi:hypothetical protein